MQAHIIFREFRAAARVSGATLLALICLVGSTGGCAQGTAAAEQIVLRGPRDLLPLMDLFRRGVGASVDGEVIVEASPTALDDLEDGVCDLAFAGRELSVSEIDGLTDTVIGLDAVCILIDENSYCGGEYWSGALRVRRTEGLKQMTWDELVAAFSFWVVEPAERQLWSGDYQGWTPGGWRPQETVVFNVFVFPAGKYDTQSVLYDALGLGEQEVVDAMQHETSQTLSNEAEVLSFQYKDAPPYRQHSGDFMFKLGFASRCISQAAVTRVPVRVISVDGMDPLADPECIYDGSYPFTRQLQLLSRPDDPSSVAAIMREWALSEAGQQAIAEAGYLPLR